MFSLKTIIYAILSSEMLRENHAVLGGGDILYSRFPRGGGGGGVQNRFVTKYRHDQLRYNVSLSPTDVSRPNILRCCIPWTKYPLTVLPLTEPSHPQIQI
jgi:hypothetical protein